MAKVVKTNELPVITDLTNAKVIGLSATGTDAQFPLAQIVRNNIGSVKTTDAAPVGPLLGQSVKLIGSGVPGSNASGTYTNLLKAASTPIVIPSPAAGNGIFEAFAKWNGSYWIPEWQELPLPIQDISGLTPKTDFNALSAKLPFVPSKNLFDQTQVIVGSFVAGSSGNISTGLGTGYAIFPLTVAPGQTYTMSGTMAGTVNGAVRYEDVSGNKLSWTQYGASLPFTFTTPANCVKVYLDVKNNATVDYNTIQIELGSSATAYVPFAPVLPKSSLDLSGLLSQSSGDARYVVPAQTRNLFYAANVVIGSFVSGASGNISTGLGSNYALYPMVTTPSTQYTLSGNITSPTSGAIRFEDAAGTKLSWVACGALPFTFTTPANCVKIYVDVKNNAASDFSTIQIETGASATAYTAPLLINSALLDFTGLQGAKYSGLKIAYLTDSFGGFNIYQAVVNGILKTSHINFSVGGSCITPGFESLPNGSSDQRLSGFARADQLTAATKDVIVLQMTVNDGYYMNQSNPNSNPLLPSPLLGTINDTPLASIPAGYTTNGVGATITYASALKGIFVKIMANNPNNPLFMVGPTPQFINGFARSKEYSMQEPFAILAQQICAYYGIPYADAFHTFGINYENKAVTTRDNIHPTDAYFIQYGKKVAGFLNAQ
ncbi:SGNH/GDSL hydrolase family protein [Mucilaginibacter endophyticus]|uniref:SGNH/GDSL hydrolase family protein n=1 Tax=Mucilaginibacter endophyticus TaxID=2675003 RepID=UPI000E0CF6A8|nr:SGNH/GDSL hydrolase family protein [Mucilaginibacter endophyticus]